jgi:hypothetical protein
MHAGKALKLEAKAFQKLASREGSKFGPQPRSVSTCPDGVSIIPHVLIKYLIHKTTGNTLVQRSHDLMVLQRRIARGTPA